MTVASERVVNGIKTRVLHGKDYVEVAERVRIAHSGDAEFEQFNTEHFNIENRWFVRCVILVKGRKFIGTAEIKFTAPKNTPDGTNPFECAETSALGRALAFAGLGTVESIASFDEVYRVQSIEAAEMNGRPVIEAAKPRQIAQPTITMTDEHMLPASNGHAEPEQSDGAKTLFNRCRARAYKLGIKKPDEWAAFRQKYAKKDSDEAMSVTDIALLNGELTIREKNVA
jgi:hypothetical protein